MGGRPARARAGCGGRRGQVTDRGGTSSHADLPVRRGRLEGGPPPPASPGTPPTWRGREGGGPPPPASPGTPPTSRGRDEREHLYAGGPAVGGGGRRWARARRAL